MKFTDGNWFKRKGVQMLHPVEVREHEITADALSVFAPPTPVLDRGSGLNTPLLEVRFSSPFADIIRVQVFHHKGGQEIGPHFAVYSSPGTSVNISETDDEAMLSSGKLTARVRKGRPWSVDFSYAGRKLTRSSSRNTAYITINETD